MTLPDWINDALSSELELIRAEQDSHVKLLELVVHSPECKLVWEKSERLTIVDCNGQIWLAHTILKVLDAIGEDMTEAEKWRESTLGAADKLRNKLRIRPKRKYVTECEYMVAKLNELIEGFKVNFKTTNLPARPSKGVYADSEHFAKKLTLEYLKQCNNAHEADVRRITNALQIDNGGIFKRNISESSVLSMADKAKADYAELTAGEATTPSTIPE